MASLTAVEEPGLQVTLGVARTARAVLDTGERRMSRQAVSGA